MDFQKLIKDPRAVVVLKLLKIENAQAKEISGGVLKSVPWDEVQAVKLTATLAGRPVSLLVVTDK